MLDSHSRRVFGEVCFKSAAAIKVASFVWELKRRVWPPSKYAVEISRPYAKHVQSRWLIGA